jgi:hypothetical protein
VLVYGPQEVVESCKKKFEDCYDLMELRYWRNDSY